MPQTAAPPRPNPNMHQGPGQGPNHQPSPQANDEKLRIVLTSLDSNVDAFAREAAHEKLSERPEGRFFKRAVKSAWNQVKREYDVVKETQKAREEIRESGNLLHHHGTSDEQWREAIVARRTSEFGEDLIREGETFHNLSSPEAQNDPEAQQIRADILDTARRFARDEIVDAASLEEDQKRRNENWKEQGISQKYLGEAEFLAENELAMCEQAKAAYEAAKAQSNVDEDAELEKLLTNADVIVGEGKVGSTAEIEATLSERLAGKLKDSKFLNESRIAKAVSFLGNETTVAAITSVAVATGKSAFSKGVAVVAIPGLGGGAIAALRERKALKQERALERRRMDRGLSRELISVKTEDMTKWERAKDLAGMGPNSRRAELGETMYQTRGAKELIGNMGDLYDQNGDLQMRSRSELNGAVQQLAEIKARIKATDTGDTLIGFGGIPEEEKENVRTDLMLAMSKLETDIEKLFSNPAAAAMLDIKATEKFEDLVTKQQGMIDGVLKGEMKQTDKLFNKLVTKRSGGRAFLGGATGMFASLGVHTVGSVVNGPSNTQTPTVQRTAQTTGLRSSPNGDANAPTSVGGDSSAPSSVGGPEAPTSVGGSQEAPTTVGGSGEAPTTVGGEGPAGGIEHDLSDTSRLNLPDGYGAEVHGDQLTVTTPDGQTIEGLKLNSDGSLSVEAQQSLEGAGLHIKDDVEFIKGEPQPVQQEVSANDFARNHMHEMKTIHHKGWMDNNTHKSELKLINTRDANGNIIISAQGWAGSGSFHGASGINWHDAAADERLKVYTSAGVGSGAHAFESTLNTDGITVIDKDSPAAALYDAKGQPIGGFEEVALNTGTAPDGGENIVTLATAVGAHHETLTDTVTTTSGPQAHHTYTVVAESANVTPSFFTSPGSAAANAASSVFTPVYGRERLGKARDEMALRQANGRRQSQTNNGNLGANPGANPSPGNGNPNNAPGNPNARKGNPNNSGESAGAGLPEGYDLSGVSEKYGIFAKSTATRFIEIAEGELDSGDKLAVAIRAREFAEAALQEVQGLAADNKEFARQTVELLDEIIANLEAYSTDETSEAGPDSASADLEDNPPNPEQDYLDKLDAEKLDFPLGYDFKGMGATYDGRTLKMAARLLRQAETELGTDDRVAVVVRASELASTAQGAADPELKAIYEQTTKLFADSEAQTRRRAARTKAKASSAGDETETSGDEANEASATPEELFYHEIDNETRDFPYDLFGRTSSRYSDRQRKLATRMVFEAWQHNPRQPTKAWEIGITESSECFAAAPWGVAGLPQV